MKVIFFIAFFAIYAFANIAKISAVVGDAELLRGGEVFVLELGALLEREDSIETKANAKVQIIFEDNTIVTVGKNSSVYIKDYLYDATTPEDSKADLHFLKGAFQTITGNIAKINKEKFKLQTKNATIGIRGTTVLANQKTIACLVGAIEVEVLGDRALVEANRFVQIKEDKTLSFVQKLDMNVLRALEEELEAQGRVQGGTSGEDLSALDPKESTLPVVEREKLEDLKNPHLRDDVVMQTILRNDYENKVERLEAEHTEPEPTEPIDPQPTDPTEPIDPQPIDPTDPDPTDPDPTEPIDPQPTDPEPTEPIEPINPEPTDPLEPIDPQPTDPTDPEPIADTMQGSFLGGYNSTDQTNLKSYSTTLSGGRTENTIIVSGQNTQDFSDPILPDHTLAYYQEFESTKSFDPIRIGGFTDYSEVLRRDLFVEYGAPYEGDFVLLADNMGEVIIGYTDALYENIPLRDLFVLGVDADMSRIDMQSYYVYDFLQAIRVEQIDNGVYGAEFRVYNDKIYYNPHLHSYTLAYKKGSTLENFQAKFFAGNSSGLKHLYNSYVSEESADGLQYVEQTFKEETLLQSSLKGTDFQAFTANVLGAREEKNFADAMQMQSSYESLMVYGLEKKVGYLYEGEYLLSGFLSGKSLRANSEFAQSSHGSFEMSVNRSSGVFQTESFWYDDLGLSAQGSVADGSAYYVNDDLFGSLLSFTGNAEYSSFYGLTMIGQSAYLISIPDGAIVDGVFALYDLSDNPLMSDDESSWGYWTAAFEEDGVLKGHIDTRSVWVAGTQTPQDYVQALIDNDQVALYNFQGKVLGDVVLANALGHEQIKMDATNKVDLRFEFGAGNGSMSGNIQFESASTAWNLEVNSLESSVYSEGFYGSLGDTSATHQGDSGYLEGKFYGSDDIKSVGGSFGAHNMNYDSASGVFKATK